ncbi:hypothetical protein METBIDRAFT_208561 [Metschnikowia bicuspidata var. bicuspidata NRRL YB-4993]|uniref:EamA domain-containing protein n=1 Tax=Metschnikowia bicuspidata var. bicuspidata NRRL YB-4993 TaxID=869754 RepID=A0A1A0H705_9ASCO|nr:hypothetical protein METBIDRAFT_208561 [Metschnikowia bicuspidata var. bicuspidata NRRL YB-4993]OBA19816.1 hypothetical protein METBIDRAFT_208561 [Metschnikowia bicuspidata var. bicuspidata NRRL YB-4993]
MDATKVRVSRFYYDVVTPNLGVSLLLTSQFLNTIMILTCKLLEVDPGLDTPIHPVQILFVRMLITYACCVLYMVTTKRVPDAPFGPKGQRTLLFLRGFLGFFGVFGLYYSLQYLSLSDAVTITFLIPMVTAFFAWIVLGEKYSLLEAVCSLLSLGGILLVAKPDFLFGLQSESETPQLDSAESSNSGLRVLGTVVGLLGVCGASAVYVLLRKIGKAAHPLISVSYFALTTCVICFCATILVPSLSFKAPANARQWFLFSLIGLSGFFMQFCLAAGLQLEKAGKSSLMIYSNMVFALVWDFVFWGHVPGMLSILGTSLILANAYIIIKYKPSSDAGDSTDLDMEANGGKYDAPGEIDMDFLISDEDEGEDEGSLR